MQDIMSAIIRNRNVLNKQYKEVESELDYLHLEGYPVAIQEALESIQEELDKVSFVNCTPQWLSIEGIGVIPPSGILPMVLSLQAWSAYPTPWRVSPSLSPVRSWTL